MFDIAHLEFSAHTSPPHKITPSKNTTTNQQPEIVMQEEKKTIFVREEKNNQPPKKSALVNGFCTLSGALVIT